MLTINDIQLTGATYQDIYLASSIVIGTPLIIQNKSSTYPFYLQISSTAPPTLDRDGYLLLPGKQVFVDNATEGLFAFGTGRLHVSQDV